MNPPNADVQPDAPGEVQTSSELNRAGSATESAPQPTRDTADMARRLLDMESNTVLMALIALVVVVGVLHPSFFTLNQLTGVVQQSVYIAVLAAGMAFLVSMREIDLSVGGSVNVCVVVGALLVSKGMNPWIAGLAMIAIGAACGAVNAACVQLVKLPTIVATLATMSMFSGLALAIAGGQPVVLNSTRSSFFSVFGGNIGGGSGVPTAVPILVGVVVLLTVVLRFTPFGYRVRSIGSNPDAAVFSGIRVSRVRVQTLVLMGVLAGFAAVLTLAFFETGDPNTGNNWVLQVIAAAIIGGTPLRGGTATVVGAAFGALLLGVVNTGLAFFNVPTNWSEFATGAVILFAVSLDSALRLRRQGQARRLSL
jgi:ribose transport system permease protein